MKNRSQFPHPDREAATRRYSLGLFLVFELLCTGALVAAAIHWM